MQPLHPPKVEDSTEYWNDPPPEQSPRCKFWVDKIRHGWKPNKRISSMDYEEAAEFYGIYIWEYFHVIFPMGHLKELIAAKTIKEEGRKLIVAL